MTNNLNLRDNPFGDFRYGVVVDLETAGLSASAPIASIGAVIVDFSTKTLIGAFYRRINIHDMSDLPPKDMFEALLDTSLWSKVNPFSLRNRLIRGFKKRHFTSFGKGDFGTIRWWMDQDPEVQESAFGTDTKGVDLIIALLDIQDWISAVTKGNESNTCLLGFGATFDNAKLEHFCTTTGIPQVSASYKGSLCLRTLFVQQGIRSSDYGRLWLAPCKITPPRYGIRHGSELYREVIFDDKFFINTLEGLQDLDFYGEKCPAVEKHHHALGDAINEAATLALFLQGKI